MKRQETFTPRPTAGFGSVPLFNQGKRNRVPLTSAPSEKDIFFHSEFMEIINPATSASTSKSYGRCQASGPSSDAAQSNIWKTQSIPASGAPLHYGSRRAAPGPAVRHCAPGTHPYKARDTGTKMGAHSKPVRHQENSSVTNFRQSGSSSAQWKPMSDSAFSQMSQNSLRAAFSTQSKQSRPVAYPISPPNGPPVHAAQPEKSSWRFTHSFGSRTDENRGSSHYQATRKNKVQETSKPASENSLRILTAVIAGMKHWSQLKDRIPHLVEIFATLDSAVTLGQHGAKNFLMRDGKDVIQCVFYENALPRLIRGQVHRCVGNYDCRRDLLTCVSVRPGQPSELPNAPDAVKVCDTEMRVLLQSFSEV
ncbi:spermatogenesis-associated protein 22 isoform X2 [Takifugu flavidus]|uniref:spermatogenesis-associated protein 22 isoform X2 n=1 Tax=Takifugu flavidus TaxID=433684 RepID=UPI002544A245|nr:spermatogenesis-associated protein 22 isoform X2 [Takifugu flavidus]